MTYSEIRQAVDGSVKINGNPFEVSNEYMQARAKMLADAGPTPLIATYPVTEQIQLLMTVADHTEHCLKELRMKLNPIMAEELPTQAAAPKGSNVSDLASPVGKQLDLLMRRLADINDALKEMTLKAAL